MKTFKNLDKNHLCAYCRHSDYFGIGGLQGMESRNNKKIETGMDIVVIVKLHDLKGQKTFL